MAKKVGVLIKEARTGAGLTQEQLARKIKGISADDISKAERGEKALTQAVLKEIAKATGVTQKSLLDAAKAAGSGSTTASRKTSSSGSTSARKKTTSSGSTSARKKTTGKTAKTTASTFKVSAQEKKLINAYREADDKVKAAVNFVLLGNDSLSSQKGTDDMLSALLSGVKELFGR